MAYKKTHIVIGALIVFWIIFIGWGMFKTTIKLSKGKTIISKQINKTTQEKIISEKTQDKKPSTEESTAPSIPSPIMVRTFKVKASDFQDILPVMGTIKAKTEIELRFEITGTIKKIYFREGEKIKKGDLIASLDDKDINLKIAYAKNKLNASQAAYNSIQKKLDVHKKLFDAGAIIKSKLEEVELECESARFQVETSRSEMALAENELNKTKLYAATDGVMGPREKEEGEFITPQDKLGSLFEISDVFVEAGVVERDINKVKLGQKAKIYVDTYPNIAFDGKIDSIFPIVEGKSRTLTVKIKVPNAEGHLFPGMFSRADIFIVELKNAFIIPATSLIPSGKGIYVVPVIPKEYVQKGEDETSTGIVQLCHVNVGYLTSDYAQITQGLKSEDLVVIEAQGELKDNTSVKIVGIEESTF